MEKKPYTKKISYLKNYITNEYIYLNFPIIFEINIESNGFYYTNKEYNIYAYWTTQEDAELDIFNEFEFQYKEYAMESDENLDKNAKELKYKLLAIFGGKNA